MILCVAVHGVVLLPWDIQQKLWNVMEWLVCDGCHKTAVPGEPSKMRSQSRPAALNCFRAGELCCLIEGLPNPNNGGSHAKAVHTRNRAAGRDTSAFETY